MNIFVMVFVTEYKKARLSKGTSAMQFFIRVDCLKMHLFYPEVAVTSTVQTAFKVYSMPDMALQWFLAL